jgi:hypothetical protein
MTFEGPLAAAWPPITAALLAPPAECLPVSPAALAVAHPATVRRIAEQAVADLGEPWPVLRAQDFARYFRDGDRETYEQINWVRERRLSRAAVLAAVHIGEQSKETAAHIGEQSKATAAHIGEQSKATAARIGEQSKAMWLDEVADGVVVLCEQSTWCWPAHEQAPGLPDVTRPTLDLGASNVADQLAWIDHLLGDRLDQRMPGLRARLRHEVDVRVLRPFEDRHDWHWLGLDGDAGNWTPWIHGHVLVAALRLVDDPERRARLVARAVEGLDRYTAALPADGAVDEGYSYWWNGAGRLLEALDILAYASRGALPVPDLPALRATVAFPHRVHLGGDWFLNHADGYARIPHEEPWSALHRAARRFGDRLAEALAAAHRRPPDEPVAGIDVGLGRLLRALTDPEWIAATPEAAAPAGDVWFPSIQVLIARSAALTLAVKGGHNDEHHNHNDVGSVVVALRGVPVLADPGRPTYTAQTFGPDRYRIWTMQSSWHSTPTIRGTAQADGREFAARDVTASGTALTLDLTEAYPRNDVRSWRRTARLDHDVVVVSDAWELDPAGDAGPTVIHYVLAGTVTTGDGWAEVVALDGAGTLRLDWTPGVPGTVAGRELTDPALSSVWGERLTRLDLDVSGLGPVAGLVLTVREQR